MKNIFHTPYPTIIGCGYTVAITQWFYWHNTLGVLPLAVASAWMVGLLLWVRRFDNQRQKPYVVFATTMRNGTPSSTRMYSYDFMWQVHARVWVTHRIFSRFATSYRDAQYSK